MNRDYRAEDGFDFSKHHSFFSKMLFQSIQDFVGQIGMIMTTSYMHYHNEWSIITADKCSNHIHI